MTTETRIVNLAPMADAKTYLANAVKLAGQVPDGAEDPAKFRSAGVLGAGAMGRGIAMAFAQTGRSVVLVDPSQDALNSAELHVTKLADRQVAKGRMSEEDRTALLARFSFSTQVSSFAGADMVVEAVPEIMGLKQKVMGEIEAVVAADALIATNTSTLDIDEIGAGMRDASRYIGMHFFIPAQVNPLLEVIPALATSETTLATCMALALDLRKHAVIAANGDGFIGNRLFDRFHQEAMYLVEEGALPAEVDGALERWGMAIGPFRALDLVGNDIPWGVRKQRAERDNPPCQPRVGDALCEAGLFGQKTGRGWFFYDSVTPRGRAYEDVNALIHRVSAELGITRRRISEGEIVGRCVTALIVESQAMLAEGRASRASDIDMTYVTGYGFPAAFGGPMRIGDEIGLTEIFALAQSYGRISGRADAAWRFPDVLATEGMA